jgi:hypothetical protein
VDTISDKNKGDAWEVEVIKVTMQLKETSQNIDHENVVNTYTKGPLYCVYIEGETVYKYPIESIWRIKEEYGYHGRD